MLALSIRQPYVEQILSGVKLREYRSRACHIRGCFLLHASKTAEAGGEGLPLGCLVGIADLIECEQEADGTFAWLLAEPVRFSRPIPFRGAAGWFEVPDEMVAQAIDEADVLLT